MAWSFNKFKQELGKACAVGFISTILAAFVTVRITDYELEIMDYFIFGIVASGFLIATLLLLREEDNSPKITGKWKRVKIKKDTVIHIAEEQ